MEKIKPLKVKKIIDDPDGMGYNIIWDEETSNQEGLI